MREIDSQTIQPITLSTRNIMNSPQFTNARVHEWLTSDLDVIVKSMRTTRVQLNSAALWWFCTKLTAQERAEILGDYVTHQALSASPAEPPTNGKKKKKANPAT